MREPGTGLSGTQRLGLAVFIGAVAATVVMIYMGVAGVAWPKWLLAVAAIL